jgi:hypothetical protein
MLAGDTRSGTAAASGLTASGLTASGFCFGNDGFPLHLFLLPESMFLVVETNYDPALGISTVLGII